MATKLQELGVDIIEAGFPIASEGDFAAVKAVAASAEKLRLPRFAALPNRTSRAQRKLWQVLRIRAFIPSSPPPTFISNTN